MTRHPPGTVLVGWLTLLRLPNLFTVPGDPLAGFMLARMGGVRSGSAVAAGLAAGAALLLYAGGLILNDDADIDEDRRDRPNRPLPAGRVSRPAARFAWISLFALGIACAFATGATTGIVALTLVGAIVLYDTTVRHAIAGSLLMGACRGLSLLLGAAAAGWAPAIDTVAAAAVGLSLYIAAVTAIADRETEHTRIGPKRWLPNLTIVLLLGVVLPSAPTVPGIVALTVAVPGIAVVAAVGARLGGTPAPSTVGPSIGRLIRALVPLQAALAMASGGTGYAVGAAILCLWPTGAILSRRFYAS